MYNATIFEIRDPHKNGELQLWSTFVAEVDSKDRMLRSNAIQCTGLEGSPEYDKYIRARLPESTFEIIHDNCEGYLVMIGGDRENRRQIKTLVEAKAKAKREVQLSSSTKKIIKEVRDFALNMANDRTLYENEAFAEIAEDLSTLLSEPLHYFPDIMKWGLKDENEQFHLPEGAR